MSKKEYVFKHLDMEFKKDQFFKSYFYRDDRGWDADEDDFVPFNDPTLQKVFKKIHDKVAPRNKRKIEITKNIIKLIKEADRLEEGNMKIIDSILTAHGFEEFYDHSYDDTIGVSKGDLKYMNYYYEIKDKID